MVPPTFMYYCRETKLLIPSKRGQWNILLGVTFFDTGVFQIHQVTFRCRDKKKKDREAGKRHFLQTFQTHKLWSRFNNYRHLKTKTYAIFLSQYCQCCHSSHVILSTYWYTQKMRCLDGASGQPNSMRLISCCWVTLLFNLHRIR